MEAAFPRVVVVRGGGDLASGVIVRLARAGLRVVITELPEPQAVRRLVSFSEAVYSQQVEIEGLRAQLATLDELPGLFARQIIPVLVDPQAQSLSQIRPQVLIDARMLKQAPELPYPAEWFTIGLGPGFVVGKNCDAAVETKRGPRLGRLMWQGEPEKDTGQPDAIGNRAGERVLRAPQTGVLHTLVQIGEQLPEGALVARVGQTEVSAQFSGVVRGLLRNGTQVLQGMKIGDLDPRSDPELCTLVSDKALAVAGGVMEAILTVPELRQRLWCNPSA